MAEISIGSMKKASSLVKNYDTKIADEIRAEEDKVDIYEDILGSYLVKLAAKDMSESESADVTMLLHLIGDFERISDHSVNIVESAEEIKDKGISFSADATQELETLSYAVNEICSLSIDALENSDFEKAFKVEPLEQVVDNLKNEIKRNHTVRLRKNLCSIELGFILSDILTDYERVADHCSNIAGCLIEMSQKETLDIHSYLHTVKKGGSEYDKCFKEYSAKYAVAEASDN